jgi:hypothetical protein
MKDMWEALERYQHWADERGFGAEWKRMTTERTEEAAAACRAADEVWIDAVDECWGVSAEMAAAKATLAYLNKLIEGDPMI